MSNKKSVASLEARQCRNAANEARKRGLGHQPSTRVLDALAGLFEAPDDEAFWRCAETAMGALDDYAEQHGFSVRADATDATAGDDEGGLER